MPTQAPKETKTPEAAKAPKEKGGKAEPISAEYRRAIGGQAAMAKSETSLP